MENYGEKIRRIRKEKGLTLVEVAGRAGISHAYLSQLENGKAENPTRKTEKAIFEALDAVERNVSEHFNHLESAADFGTELRKSREKKGVSLRELARRAGISHPYLSQIETGKRAESVSESVKASLMAALDEDYVPEIQTRNFIKSVKSSRPQEDIMALLRLGFTVEASLGYDGTCNLEIYLDGDSNA